MFGIEVNRIISIERGQYIQIQKLEDWQDDEQTAYLKDYGTVKVFRQIYKKSYRYYIMSPANLSDFDKVVKIDFNRVHAAHWSIGRYHRALKQVCNIERFQVRKKNQIKNYVFCALKAFVRLEFVRFDKTIVHWYEIKRDLFLKVIRKFINGKAIIATSSMRKS